MDLPWTFEDEVVDEIPGPDVYGFVYEITYEDKSKYIGKKNFYKYVLSLVVVYHLLKLIQF